MVSIASPLFDVAAAPDVETTPFSDELAEFAVRAPQQTPANLLRDRVDEELRRWMEDTAGLRRTGDRQRESVLQFWRRMSGSGEYRILPKVARIVFAVPASSAQIERDFGVSGMMVTTQRASLAGHTIDVSSFLNRNRTFVDPEQCAEIPKDEIHQNIPSNTVFPLDETLLDDGTDRVIEIDGMIQEFFSNTSLEDQ
jgi:hypothetical protein